jgi:hypothetical protein
MKPGANTSIDTSFSDLQRRFLERHRGRSPGDLLSGTVVVVPSLSFVTEELKKITAIEYYEHRLLCALLWLDNPELRIVFVSSVAVEDSVLEYVLRHVPNAADVRNRLQLISVDDASPAALSQKLLDRPDILESVRASVRDLDRFILPFNVTELERRLAVELDVPLYGPSPDLVALGNKSGSRQVARRAGVPVLAGAEDLYSLEEVELALEAIRLARPEARSAVIKLNNGFSGQGNAIVDLASFERPVHRSPTIFCAEEESWPTYARKIETEGGIVEELVRTRDVVSPSVQLRISPGGHLEIISTHDQVLGGPDDQVYLGCRFPARPEYRGVIQDYGWRVAEVLASEGVIGSFGIDFILDGDSNAYLTEINLRMGGTTHPFMTASRVTQGTYDASSGQLMADGHPKHYVASDNLKSKHLVGLQPADLIDTIDASGLAFDQTSNTGATLHLLGAVTRYGKLGTVCIANSAEEADALYKEIEATLMELGRYSGSSGAAGPPER